MTIVTKVKEKKVGKEKKAVAEVHRSTTEIMNIKPTHQLEGKFEMHFFDLTSKYNDKTDDNRSDILNKGKKTHQGNNGGRSRGWASQKVIINFIHSSNQYSHSIKIMNGLILSEESYN